MALPFLVLNMLAWLSYGVHKRGSVEDGQGRGKGNGMGKRKRQKKEGEMAGCG